MQILEFSEVRGLRGPANTETLCLVGLGDLLWSLVLFDFFLARGALEYGCLGGNIGYACVGRFV